MDILDDMGVSKLSAKVFSKVNYSFNVFHGLCYTDLTCFLSTMAICKTTIEKCTAEFLIPYAKLNIKLNYQMNEHQTLGYGSEFWISKICNVLKKKSLLLKKAAFI